MSDHLELLFPNLSAANYRITSPTSPDYNCVAWAAGDESEWWWPDPFGDYYWPPEAPRNDSIEAFILAYRMLGYHVADSSEIEPEYEKVAIYVDERGIPTHVARQLRSGTWTSKLGQLEDIEHNGLDCLCGEMYGKVAIFLKRHAERS